MPAQPDDLAAHRSPDPEVRRAAYDQVRATQNLPPLTDAEWAAEQDRAQRIADRLRTGLPAAVVRRAAQRLMPA
jgi:hypothetical protein